MTPPKLPSSLQPLDSAKKSSKLANFLNQMITEVNNKECNIARRKEIFKNKMRDYILQNLHIRSSIWTSCISCIPDQTEITLITEALHEVLQEPEIAKGQLKYKKKMEGLDPVIKAILRTISDKLETGRAIGNPLEIYPEYSKGLPTLETELGLKFSEKGAQKPEKD